MKTQTKIALIAGFSCVLLVLLFGTTVYYFQNNYAYVDFYKRLETRARISVQYNLYADAMSAENLMTLRNSYLEKLEKEKEYVIKIKDYSELKNQASKFNLPLSFLENLYKTGQFKDKKGSIFYVGIREKKIDAIYLVIVSAENYYFSHHLLFLRNMLFVSMVIIVLIVTLSSLYFSRHIFDPIKKITDNVKQISTQNIHLRLETDKNNHEINELTNTFNDLLNRIETAFETQKNFISNASHELGTPLTAIIGEADVALLKERSNSEYQKSLNNILNQAERLNQITKSLLFLAQTGYKGKAIHFERIRIDEIIWQTMGITDKINPNNKIVFDIGLLPEDPLKLKVKGNRELLQLAFANILSNACKYSNNGPVTIAVASSNTNVIILIEDQGIGIPESEIQFIFDPFFRATNTKMFEGYGIGMPLSRNVILIHKGELSVSSTINKGTSVKISLPIYQI
ncbi:MAG TPA: HAMP domain-containing sensor histidine kinase [Bacteroidia bacterium]